MLATGVLGAQAAISPVGAATAQAVGDGTKANSAGASCWGIKQAFPTSADGIYWLQTPTMPVAQQFSCDMTTDGGGWVLVGRGRDGWKFLSNGQGSSADIRNTPTGPGAFKVATLPTATIDGLLNNGAMKDQADGIRVVRAADTAGTTWQDWRLAVKSEPHWSWAFDGAIQLTSRRLVGGATYAGGNTYDTYSDYRAQPAGPLFGIQGSLRMWTYTWAAIGNVQGFNYGAGVVGTTSATSYLWSPIADHAVPFTQVWIRPQIANSVSFASTAIPAYGFAADVKPWELKDQIEPATWGVSGLNRDGDAIAEPDIDVVLAVLPMGDRVYVGGKFTTVNHGPTGETYAQPFLAAFDRTTGDWIPTFRPVLDGRVVSMIAAPNGKLIVGGDFLSVNGTPKTTALAMLDPATGAVDPTWRASFSRGSGTGRAYVRGMDIANGALYAVGGFSGVTAGTWNAIKVSNAVKLNVANANPIQTWKAVLDGPAMSVKVSADGTRTFVTGYFASVQGADGKPDTNMHNAAWLDSTAGLPLPGMKAWVPNGSTPTTYLQQMFTQDPGNGNVIQGGSNHILQMYSAADRTLVQRHLTAVGGDFQSSAMLDGKLYATCHCWNFDYLGGVDFNLATYSSVQPINGIGRYSTTDLSYETGWYPSGMASALGDGIWTMAPDTQNHCLWFGGDVVRRSWSGNPTQDWVGNFGRFCSKDHTAPTAPTAMTVKKDVPTKTVKLTWKAASDESGTVTYNVYRNDRIVASTTSLSYSETAFGGTNSYTVRASDGQNQSASPAPVAIAP